MGHIKTLPSHITQNIINPLTVIYPLHAIFKISWLKHIVKFYYEDNVILDIKIKRFKWHITMYFTQKYVTNNLYRNVNNGFTVKGYVVMLYAQLKNIIQ